MSDLEEVVGEVGAGTISCEPGMVWEYSQRWRHVGELDFPIRIQILSLKKNIDISPCINAYFLKLAISLVY